MKTSCGLGFTLSRQNGYLYPLGRLKISKISKFSQAQARQEDGAQWAAAMSGWQGAPCWELQWAEGSCETSPVGLLTDCIGEFPLRFLAKRTRRETLFYR